MRDPLAQARNDEMVALLKPDFLTRPEAFLSGAQLVSSVLASRVHSGGGARMYGFLADTESLESYIGSQQLTAPNVVFGDWGATVNGGPYLSFNGINQALYITDAAWQEPGANTFFTWHWAFPSAINGTIVSKYDINGNNASWRLWAINVAPTSFQFVVNGTGNPANDVVVTSSVSVTLGNWYFVAGYFVQSTLQRVYVGQPSDDDLTIDSNAVGIPAAPFNGTAPLAIGTAFNNAPTLLTPFTGRVGVGGTRIGVIQADVDAYARWLYAETREKYAA